LIPSSDRDYIGRMFAITVLGGMGSIGGTLVAAIILGLVENLMRTFFGPRGRWRCPSASCSSPSPSDPRPLRALDAPAPAALRWAGGGGGGSPARPLQGELPTLLRGLRHLPVHRDRHA
jgi:hypothetical protein